MQFWNWYRHNIQLKFPHIPWTFTNNKSNFFLKQAKSICKFSIAQNVNPLSNNKIKSLSKHAAITESFLQIKFSL